jgi:hypothetical protein
MHFSGPEFFLIRSWCGLRFQFSLVASKGKNMYHPMQQISSQSIPRLFLILLISTIALFMILNQVSTPLITSKAPQGIVSFELAGNSETVNSILDSWDTLAKLTAAFSLGLDYLFMIFYSTTLSLGCVWSGLLFEHNRKIIGIAFSLIAWGQWLAAFFDGLENFGLMKSMLFAPISPWPEIARWSASCKFLLIFLGLISCLMGFAINVIHHLARLKRSSIVD